MDLDLRILTRIILKLVGVYLLVALAITAPAWLLSDQPLKQAAIIYTVAWAIVGSFLVWYPGVIENRIILFRGPDAAASWASREVLGVGIVLLGLFFSIAGFQSIVFVGVNAALAGGFRSPIDYAHLIEAIVQFMLGTLCVVRREWVLSFANETREPL